MSDNSQCLEYTAQLQLAQRASSKLALKKGKCADVTFQIGTEERCINCSRLAFISPVFEGMLFGECQGRPDPAEPIILECITLDAFDCIIKYAYGINPEITPKSIFSLILACKRIIKINVD